MSPYLLLKNVQSREEENLVDLESTIREKEVLMESLIRQEQAREWVIAHLAAELKLSAVTSLSDLITHYDGVIAQKLTKLRQEFIGLVEQLLTLHYGNQLLLQATLARTTATFDYLTTAIFPSDGNYTVNGSIHTRQQDGIGNVLNWQI